MRGYFMYRGEVVQGVKLEEDMWSTHLQYVYWEEVYDLVGPWRYLEGDKDGSPGRRGFMIRYSDNDDWFYPFYNYYVIRWPDGRIKMLERDEEEELKPLLTVSDPA